MTTERIQKLLSRAGYGSRREIERWIGEGRITLNGKVAQPGDKASAEDKIFLLGKRLYLNRVSHFKPRVVLYHKPEGEIVTRNDPEGRASAFSRLPKMKSSRWIAVGRLDINTTGLLLFSNDGELTNRLMHPSSEIEREYAVRVLGEVKPEILSTLKAGVTLDDGTARFDRIHDAGGSGANHWYHVIITEGRKREVRRLWESQGLKVSRLMRVRYGPQTLDRWLKPGRWRELKSFELERLYQSVGLVMPVAEGVWQSKRRR